MDLKGLNVAVIGAGYAGATTAKAFINAGANVTVYEQAQEIKEVGAGIGLRPSSMNAFKKLGIDKAIEDVTLPSESFAILTAAGDPIMEEEWPEKAEYGFTTRFVHRGDFIDTLIAQLPAGVVRTGHKLSKITDHGTSVDVEFENGAKGSYDLVIGADGIRSQVRYQLFSQQQPVFAGEHAYRVVIPVEATFGLSSDSKLRMYIGHGTKVYLLPLHHRGDVSYDITSLDTDPTPNPSATLEKIVKTVAGFHPDIVKITENLDLADVNIRAVYDIDPVAVWHSDDVALVGDAAHAMCHHQGQGANSAILDAVQIVESLQAAASIPEGLADYQAKRKPVTDELQRLSRQGWTEDELQSVFPGQKRGEIASTVG